MPVPASLLLLAFLLAACAEPPATELTPSASDEPAAATPFALVELFTSEGCSSCPPADALLGDLAARDGVIALSFHVDYWNYLGWRDPYSDAAYSARQRAYARRLDGRVYTPAMVVNGTVGFVGSRRREALQHVGAALAEAPAVSLALTVTEEGGALTVTPRLGATPDGAVLHLAVVERSTAQDVQRGENRGRRLEHTHVVRHVETVDARPEAHRLPLPGGLGADDVRVIAWVQDGPVGRVLGAAMADAG